MGNSNCKAINAFWKRVWVALPEQIKTALGNNPNNLLLYPVLRSPLSNCLYLRWLPEDPVILAIADIIDHLIICSDCREKHEIHCVNFSIGCNVPYFMGAYFDRDSNDDDLIAQIFGDAREIASLQHHFMFHREGDAGFCEYCNSLYQWDQKRRCQLADDPERGRRWLL